MSASLELAGHCSGEGSRVSVGSLVQARDLYKPQRVRIRPRMSSRIPEGNYQIQRRTQARMRVEAGPSANVLVSFLAEEHDEERRLGRRS
jgi:hypothetical protein